MLDLDHYNRLLLLLLILREKNNLSAKISKIRIQENQSGLKKLTNRDVGEEKTKDL